MKRSPRGPRWHRCWGGAVPITAILLVVGLALFGAACGVGSGVGDGGAVSTADRSETTVVQPGEPSGGSGTTELPDDQGSGDTSASDQTTPTSGPGGSTTGSTTSTPDSTTTTVDSATSTARSTTSTASSSTEKMTVNVYFARDEKIAAAARTIAKTQSVGSAAMRLLLEGPSAPEEGAGMSTAIPEGTALLGLNIRNGIATVDLSKEYSTGGGSLSMMTRLAQVVFTLTQFPTVQGVEFMLDGRPIDVLGGEGIIIDHPMTRADYEDLSPAILVESPTLGARVASPVHVWGTANTFEAVFRINIVDNDGLIIADQRVQATSGTGTRGTFDVTVKYPAGHAGNGALIVFENSAKDGSPTHVVETPIVLK